MRVPASSRRLGRRSRIAALAAGVLSAAILAGPAFGAAQTPEDAAAAAESVWPGLVTDVFDFDCDDDMREQIEKSARQLYGLVHARYIVTTRGLAKMVRRPTRYVSRTREKKRNNGTRD